MRPCLLCKEIAPPTSTHSAELLIQLGPIAIPTCLCCWYAWAFGTVSDRRRLECPTGKEARLWPFLRSDEFLRELYRQRLEAILGQPYMARYEHRGAGVCVRHGPWTGPLSCPECV